MMKYKAIIYDIDGTILNTLDMNMYPLIKIIKEELNEDYTYQDVLKFSAYPGMKVMEELHIKNKEDVYNRWVKYVNEYPGGASLYDGFLDVFEGFRDIKQAVVSSKKRAQYDIDFIEYDKYMDVVVLEEDTQKHKPDPQPLLLCIEKLGLNKEDVLYIGDHDSDYQASQNAGIDFGLALWGCSQPEGIQATYIFKSPIDLLQLKKME